MNKSDPGLSKNLSR
ncbi:hypothetical protein Bhyg_06665 [Pseudolycoriella hygida]|uniref:Uncharacterized protein n=1 Tax=Pseudolycoriella hygida TaxID=35572 RepID=A0A9Q0S323_9DIPT|nr:hypothetical protein Bhyg_06665 [Pseudolycoriella hygida]